MHLTKLEMRGFKTFADKTQLEFKPGITAIVGPNGVGKSNITDAILWALGEQSNKNLRAENSQDVIFAGTQNRRPLGMAEVSLSLDNSDHSLRSEYSEVVVARRLFRSGDSEYVLNKNMVRLRDLRDMFVDTGLGPQAYSVISQGDIDQILSIRSEDRRTLIEEVAGVRKYRLRRTEAERKLDTTRANMTRITDILHELTSQREPLEREAEKARQYNELASALRVLEQQLLAVDYQRRAVRRGSVVNEVGNLQTDLAATRTQISQLDAEYEKISLQVAQLSDALDKLRDAATAAERVADQQKQAQALGNERLGSIAARREQLARIGEQGTQRAEQLTRRTAENAQQCEELTVEVAEAAAAVTERGQQLSELQRRHQEHTAELEAELRRRREIVDRMNVLQNQATALAGMEADLQEREERLQGQSDTTGERRRQVDEELASVREQTAQTEEELTISSRLLDEARAAQQRVVRLLREHREKRGILDSAVAAGEERYAMLQELQKAHEGYGEGPRAVLGAAGEGKLAGIIGVVADHLDVPARLEVAIEAALSEELQWIIVQDNASAQAAITYLRENKLGRATFIPLGSITATPAHTPATVSMGRDGVIGLASRLVKFPRNFASIFEHLLSNLIVVKDLGTALVLRTALHTTAQIVTLQGEVVGPQGQISGGAISGSVARVFNRRRQVDEIQEVLADLRAHLAKMWEAEERLEQQGHDAADAVDADDERVSGLQAQNARLRSTLAHLGDQARALKSAVEELDEDASGLAEKLRATAEQRANAEREHKGLELEAEETNVTVNRLRAEAISEQALEGARGAFTEAQVRSAKLAEKLRSANAVRSQYAAELSRLTAELANVHRELEELDVSERRVLESLGQDSGEIGVLEEQARVLREQVGKRADELSQVREASANLDASRRQLATLREEQGERLHRLELALAREEAQLEFVAQQLMDLYELTPEAALTLLPEQFREMETRRNANQLREGIRKLGPVNLSSIDEVERLGSREQFLRTQLEDLDRARKDLVQVIEESDEAATKAFLEAFAAVKVAFEELFLRLFGGGTTQLQLTMPQAPLEGGVDVIVQAPGKRQQNLLLLSGGERALTALALLFAMIKIKPSPFCVMDEIDAALDAINTERFTTILKDFAQHSQFIVITHNPQTMVAADAHWGVTMEEPGVSMIIPLELEEAQQQAEEITAAERQDTGGGSAPAGTMRMLPTRS